MTEKHASLKNKLEAINTLADVDAASLTLDDLLPEPRAKLGAARQMVTAALSR